MTLATDPQHCGACNNACGATSQCNAGACEVCPLNFLGKVDYPVGSLPRSVTTGDFNGDGKVDLAVANINADTVSVLLGNGNGTFQTKVDYPVGANP
ncbi:MAG: VCBS repeat-containing protein, partial [Deltaproteobacteria bacterium]|nr:VCBS repeat-containing protein [Deltaproteobacteria bacterium]